MFFDSKYFAYLAAGILPEDSTFMECVRKAQSDSSDVHNLLMAILFRDENKFCDYLEKCHDKVNSNVV